MPRTRKSLRRFGDFCHPALSHMVNLHLEMLEAECNLVQTGNISVSNEKKVRKEKRILVFHLAAEFKYISSTLSYGHMEIR